MSKLKKLSKGACVLIVSIALLLISCIGASVVQTDFGNVTIKDLRWETESGHQMSALLLVPKTATKDNPAPAIVTSHGWYNTREMQDLNYVEYARRGFVVLSIDMYGHGNSETIENGTWWEDGNNANGMYDAVKLAATLPYVDATRIGVTGHSNGALASRTAVMLDNKAETPLIAAALLVSNDAVYQDAETGEYINIFGSRDAGIVACQYDEFFHRVRNEDGTTTAPRDFLKQNTAQSFLYFGEDPTGKEPRVAGTVYHADIDGQDAMRFIYNPPIIHPWAHFSKNVVTNSINFFNESLSAPNMIDATNQIWQVKVVFNFIGLVGFMMFMVGFALCMLKTRFFASLRAEKTPAPAIVSGGRGKGWLWGTLIVSTVFSMVMYMSLYKWCSANQPALWSEQFNPYYIGMWSMLCGLFALLMMVLSYQLNGKKSGVSLRENGVAISAGNLGKTILLALIVAAATYSTVFVADYFFKTDFRIWCLTIKAFTPDKLLISLKFLPFFLIYYVLNSVANNCFNYVKMGKHSWVNTFVVALFNALSPLILIIWIYATFFATGYHPMETYGIGGSIIGIWLFPVVVILPVFAVVSRSLYKATKNPYLPGIIMAILVTVMSCSNTLTVS